MQLTAADMAHSLICSAPRWVKRGVALAGGIAGPGRQGAENPGAASNQPHPVVAALGHPGDATVGMADGD